MALLDDLLASRQPSMVVRSLADQHQTICTSGEIDCLNTFTPFLLGDFVNAILLGTVISMALRYCSLFKGPSFRWSRFGVGMVALLQVAQTAVEISRMLKIFAINYGDLEYFVTARIEDAVAPFLGVVLQLQAQFFLLHRAYRYATVVRISRPIRILVTSVLAVIILGSGACGLGVAIEIKLLTTLLALEPANAGDGIYAHFVILWLVGASVVDLTLCFIITHELLSASRKGGGRPRSSPTAAQSMVNRIVLTTLRSGILLAIVQIACAVTWELGRRQWTSAGSWVYFPLLGAAKIYSMTFMSIIASTRSSTPQFDIVADYTGMSRKDLLASQLALSTEHGGSGSGSGSGYWRSGESGSDVTLTSTGGGGSPLLTSFPTKEMSRSPPRPNRHAAASNPALSTISEYSDRTLHSSLRRSHGSVSKNLISAPIPIHSSHTPSLSPSYLPPPPPSRVYTPTRSTFSTQALGRQNEGDTYNEATVAPLVQSVRGAEPPLDRRRTVKVTVPSPSSEDALLGYKPDRSSLESQGFGGPHITFVTGDPRFGKRPPPSPRASSDERHPSPSPSPDHSSYHSGRDRRQSLAESFASPKLSRFKGRRTDSDASLWTMGTGVTELSGEGPPGSGVAGVEDG